MQVWVSGIGVLGPGLDGWDNASAVLVGGTYIPTEVRSDPPDILTPRERRRTSPPVRLALNVALEAVSQSGFRAAECAPVFGSSCGDGVTLDHLLRALAEPDGLVSPTQFHNSVHNAAIGYWAIGTGSRLPATSIAAQECTLGAALLKGAMQTVLEDLPVLLAVFDMPYTEPLHSAHPMTGPFAVALVLSSERTEASLASIEIDWLPGTSLQETLPRNAALRELCLGNPAARGLPLLEALASRVDSELVLRYPADGSLCLKVAPC